MTNRSKKVIFLMGPGHCGSTLLDLILGSHPDMFSLGEFSRMGSLIHKNEKNSQKICGVCEGECPFWNRTASQRVLRQLFSRESIMDKVVSKLSSYFVTPYQYLFEWTGKSILVDSSKKPRWYKKQLYPSYKWRGVTPYLVYMLRDGRAVVNSYYRKYPERGMDKIADNWKQQMNRMNRFYDAFPGDNKMKLYYEHLATQPETVVRSICDFIGVEFKKEMLSYWVPEHHHVFGNAGTRSLIFKFREQFGYKMPNVRQANEQKEAYYGDNFYKELNLAIKLDQRWKNELLPEQLEVFERIAGNVNKPIISQIERRE